MDKLLNQIIKSDALARDKLKQAESYRKEQMASLSQRKEEIVKQENQKAIDAALKKSRKSETAAAKKLQEVERRNKIAQENMEKLYEEKHSQWEDDMVKNIINN